MTPKPDFTFIQTNGIRLHVAQAGAQDGPLVILLHGFPEFWRGWEAQIPALAAAGYRVWAPDQRGYNRSDKPPRIADYHIDTLARDVTGLIRAAGEQKAFVVGHDWGAAVAWHLVTHYPERVRKLVNMNVPHPAIMVRNLRSNIRQMLKSWYIFFFQIPRLPEWLLARDNAAFLARAMQESSAPGTFDERKLAHYREAWSQPGAITAMLNWYRSVLRASLKTWRTPPPLPRITVPTLLIWGKQDVALDHRMAQPSIDLCEQGELVFFEQASHWVQHERAEEVNRLVVRFLGR